MSSPDEVPLYMLRLRSIRAVPRCHATSRCMAVAHSSATCSRAQQFDQGNVRLLFQLSGDLSCECKGLMIVQDVTCHLSLEASKPQNVPAPMLIPKHSFCTCACTKASSMSLLPQVDEQAFVGPHMDAVQASPGSVLRLLIGPSWRNPISWGTRRMHSWGSSAPT